MADAWIFQANPKSFDVENALKHLHEFTWLASQHRDEIHTGDKVYLWEVRTDSCSPLQSGGDHRTAPSGEHSRREQVLCRSTQVRRATLASRDQSN